MKYSPPPPRTRARSLPIPSDGVAGIDTAASALMPTSGCALHDPVSPDAPWTGKKVAAVAGNLPRRWRGDPGFRRLVRTLHGYFGVGGPKSATSRRAAKYATPFSFTKTFSPARP